MPTILDIYHEAMPAAVLKKKSATEWGGPCPFCGGGNDRMSLFPDRDAHKGGHWMCRQCPPKGTRIACGDGIELAMRALGMSYTDACRELGLEPKAYEKAHDDSRPRRERAAAHESQMWTPKPVTLPSARWCETAARFVRECSATMAVSEEGQDFLSARHLTLETAKALQLGWNAHDRYDTLAAWGLPEERKENGKLRTVWLPRGLVLPVFRKSGVVAVLIRRAEWHEGDDYPKYSEIKGGSPEACYCIGRAGLPVVVMESVLDALLIWQGGRDLVSAVALKGATKRPDEGTATFLHSAARLLWSLDFDDAGRQAWPWWEAYFPEAEIFPVVEGKDPGEMVQRGVPVRDWLELAFVSDAAANALPKSGAHPELEALEPALDVLSATVVETSPAMAPAPIPFKVKHVPLGDFKKPIIQQSEDAYKTAPEKIRMLLDTLLTWGRDFLSIRRNTWSDNVLIFDVNKATHERGMLFLERHPELSEWVKSLPCGAWQLNEWY